jgi:hypothetical protein
MSAGQPPVLDTVALRTHAHAAWRSTAGSWSVTPPKMAFSGTSDSAARWSQSPKGSSWRSWAVFWVRKTRPSTMALGWWGRGLGEGEGG